MTMHLPPSTFDCDIIPVSAFFPRFNFANLSPLNLQDVPALEFVCNDSRDLEQFRHEESITYPTNEVLDFTSAEWAMLNSVNVLRCSDSFGYDIFAEAINNLHWAPND